MKKRWIGAAAAGLLLCLLAGCGKPNVVSQDFFAMDTAMNIRAYGAHAQSAVNECIRTINELETHLSRTQEGSDIFALNHAGGKPVALTEQSAEVLRSALQLAEETGGTFDPTVAPLSDLWAIGTEQAAVPEQREIDAVLPLIDYKSVKLNGLEASLPEQACVDLGGIGKGYAADRTAEILREAGVKQAVITLGGNVYVLGEKEKGVPWTVGITDPDHPGEWFAALRVTDTSVVTSGDYERYFEQGGKRYCHIFDPETGYPAETDLRSVTVVSENSTQADAQTTALFVMGCDAARKYCAEHGIEAVFVRNDHTVFVTEGLRDSFAISDTRYVYEE